MSTSFYFGMVICALLAAGCGSSDDGTSSDNSGSGSSASSKGSPDTEDGTCGCSYVPSRNDDCPPNHGENPDHKDKVFFFACNVPHGMSCVENGRCVQWGWLRYADGGIDLDTSAYCCL